MNFSTICINLKETFFTYACQLHDSGKVSKIAQFCLRKLFTTKKYQFCRRMRMKWYQLSCNRLFDQKLDVFGKNIKVDELEKRGKLSVECILKK